MMAEAVQDKIIFRALYKSPILKVSDYSCHLANNKPGNEEISTDNAIVLMRRGAFEKHFGRRKVTGRRQPGSFLFKRSGLSRVFRGQKMFLLT
jgi:hypothetical protein